MLDCLKNEGVITRFILPDDWVLYSYPLCELLTGELPKALHSE